MEEELLDLNGRVATGVLDAGIHAQEEGQHALNTARTYAHGAAGLAHQLPEAAWAVGSHALEPVQGTVEHAIARTLPGAVGAASAVPLAAAGAAADVYNWIAD